MSADPLDAPPGTDGLTVCEQACGELVAVVQDAHVIALFAEHVDRGPFAGHAQGEPRP